MKDPAFRPGPNLPRMRAAFSDHVLVELPHAKHFIQEDAPEQITEAIRNRFG
jgi:haloalkane dehalogenase